MLTLDDIKKNRADRTAQKELERQEEEHNVSATRLEFAEWATALCAALSSLTWAAGQGLPKKKMIFKDGDLYWTYENIDPKFDNRIVELNKTAALDGKIRLDPATHCWPISDRQHDVRDFEKEILECDSFYVIDD